MVTKNRLPLLIQYINLLDKSISETQLYYKFDLWAYSILRDHCHLLLKPNDINNYPKIIRSIKYNFTKNVGIAIPTYKDKKIWQDRYYEHTIRDENDLNKHIDYIHYNPIKHTYVKKAKDWEYTSFQDYVKEGYYDLDWYNIKDKHKISNCNYE